MTGQQSVINIAPSATNHHRQAFELRITQQLDRRKKRIHVEMGDTARVGAA